MMKKQFLRSQNNFRKTSMYKIIICDCSYRSLTHSAKTRLERRKSPFDRYIGRNIGKSELQTPHYFPTYSSLHKTSPTNCGVLRHL